MPAERTNEVSQKGLIINKYTFFILLFRHTNANSVMICTAGGCICCMCTSYSCPTTKIELDFTVGLQGSVIMESVNLEYFSAHKKNLTASLAAWLLAYFPDNTLWDYSQYQSLLAGVDAACAHSRRNSPPKTAPKIDSQVTERTAKFPVADTIVKVFTNYDVAKELLNAPNIIQLVDSEEEADFILTVAHFKAFTTLPTHQRVCQFPYEAAFVRKDLLPLTVRRDCYVNGVAPKWWLPCYDLSTEFHLFSEEYRARQKEGSANRWIIKPAQGTRGLGHQIVCTEGIAGLQQAAAFAPVLTNDLLYLTAGCSNGRNTERIHPETLPFDGVDRVAQLLVDRPLLVKGRKFDVRTFVFVRSFEPFEAYVHTLYYARLANKPYSVAHLTDPEVAITVSAYSEDQAIAEQQGRLLNVDLQTALEEENPNIDYPGMVKEMHTMLRELFRGAASSIGNWPQSSAYYSVDVIFDNAAQFIPAEDSEASADKPVVSYIPVPKLVEVNFMGDWHGVEAAVHSRADYEQWSTDLITVLATKRDVSDNERLIAL